MQILLNDEEIKQAIVEADKEIWAHKAHPRWEGEKYLMKAQLKRVVEWIEKDVVDECMADDKFANVLCFPRQSLNHLKKEAGL